MLRWLGGMVSVEFKEKLKQSWAIGKMEGGKKNKAGTWRIELSWENGPFDIQ